MANLINWLLLFIRTKNEKKKLSCPQEELEKKKASYFFSI